VDKLIEHVILKWPDATGFLGLVLMVVLLLGLPFGVWWWFKKYVNKDRYLFYQKVDGFLYCLDTITGKIRYSRGMSFQEVEDWDSLGGAKKK
jgi:hypothetical protein